MTFESGVIDDRQESYQQRCLDEKRKENDEREKNRKLHLMKVINH